MAVNKRTLISRLLLIVTAPLALYLMGDAIDDWFRRVVREEVYKERVIGAHDFSLDRHRIAARETAEFVDTHMPQVKAFDSTKDLMEHSLRSVTVVAP